HGEQAGRDQGRGSNLAGQCERFVRQRDRSRRVTGEDVIARGDNELEGGVGGVAAGPRQTGGLFGEAGGGGGRARNVRDVLAGGAERLPPPPRRAVPARHR